MSRPARTVPRAEAGAAGTAQDRPMTEAGRDLPTTTASSRRRAPPATDRAARRGPPLRSGPMASPAVTVQRHDSALGRWEMIRRTAPEALRPHVLGYLGYHEWTPGPFRRLEVPSGE